MSKLKTSQERFFLEFTPVPYEVSKQNVKTFYRNCYKNRIRVDENNYKVDESISILNGKGNNKKK